MVLKYLDNPNARIGNGIVRAVASMRRRRKTNLVFNPTRDDALAFSDSTGHSYFAREAVAIWEVSASSSSSYLSRVWCADAVRAAPGLDSWETDEYDLTGVEGAKSYVAVLYNSDVYSLTQAAAAYADSDSHAYDGWSRYYTMDTSGSNNYSSALLTYSQSIVARACGTVSLDKASADPSMTSGNAFVRLPMAHLSRITRPSHDALIE